MNMLMIIIVCSLISLQAQQQGSVLERQVSVYAQNQPLANILNQISWQSRVFFSYDASLIEAEKKYTVEAVNKSLFTVLHQLFDPHKFKLTELENQIIITLNEGKYNNYLIAPSDSAPAKYFFLKGKILENKKNDPISYASVSLLNKPVGTISNTDGEFLFKLNPENIYDTLIISCMGFSQVRFPAYELLDENTIFLNPVSIRIREIKVTSISPDKLLKNVRANIENNYSSHPKLMTSFYRETLKQDNRYINVSEAVIEILKSPYNNSLRQDVIRLAKGRQSPDVQPFKWLNFKLQGGPFTITMLDIIRNNEDFISEKYEHLYKYNISKVIWYNENPVYVLEFEPVKENDFHGFVGKMYIHRETFAVVHANFGFDRKGLKKATPVIIKRKPRGVEAKPTFVEYDINYRYYQGKWHLANARTSLKVKIRSRRDDINSEFYSLSELLVTDIKPTDLKKFHNSESFKQKDIFVDMIGGYDPEFWENYNIIKPDEDLKNAIIDLSVGNN